jgi:hypothetical protein
MHEYILQKNMFLWKHLCYFVLPSLWRATTEQQMFAIGLIGNRAFRAYLRYLD